MVFAAGYSAAFAAVSWDVTAATAQAVLAAIGASADAPAAVAAARAASATDACLTVVDSFRGPFWDLFWGLF